MARQDSQVIPAVTAVVEAAGLLDGLHAEGLLIEVGDRRYGMHDLLRRYARDLAGRAVHAAEGERALGRLLDYYYQHAATRAEALLARRTRPGPAPATPAALEDPAMEARHLVPLTETTTQSRITSLPAPLPV